MKTRINAGFISACLTLLVSLALWIYAATQPAYIPADGSDSGFSGMMCFFLGFVCLLMAPIPYAFIWMANIFGLAGLVLLFTKKYSIALAASCIGAVVSLLSLTIHKLPLNESGSIHSMIIGPAVIYWIVSLVVIPVGIIAVKLLGNKMSH